jgi:hypothetical protein
MYSVFLSQGTDGLNFPGAGDVPVVAAGVAFSAVAGATLTQQTFNSFNQSLNEIY